MEVAAASADAMGGAFEAPKERPVETEKPFPRRHEKDPYRQADKKRMHGFAAKDSCEYSWVFQRRLFGLGKDASFEEVVDAKNYLIDVRGESLYVCLFLLLFFYTKCSHTFSALPLARREQRSN